MKKQYPVGVNWYADFWFRRSEG